MFNSSNDDGVLLDSPLSIDPDEDRGRPNQTERFRDGDLYVDCGNALRPLLLFGKQREVARRQSVSRTSRAVEHEKRRKLLSKSLLNFVMKTGRSAGHTKDLSST